MQRLARNDIVVRYHKTNSYGDKSFKSIRLKNMKSASIEHKIQNILNQVQGIYSYMVWIYM